jgi:hypothetical protein
VPSWTWGTSEFFTAYTALTEDSVIVATALSDAVDLGAGPLAPRGSDDLVLAKIRR